MAKCCWKWELILFPSFVWRIFGIWQIFPFPRLTLLSRVSIVISFLKFPNNFFDFNCIILVHKNMAKCWKWELNLFPSFVWRIFGIWRIFPYIIQPDLMNYDWSQVILIRDHPFITSAKGLGGWGQKNGTFCWRSKYADVWWLGGSEKVPKCADVI